MTTSNPKQSILKVIGPGLLFAGSAIGVSHLVQSTRAGAMYGLGLAVFILLSMLAKYPAFLFGPRYAAATGKSLLSSYRRQGFFALAFFGISTFLTMFIGTAAVVLLTAALAKAGLGIDMSIMSVAIALCTAGMTLLIIGQYHWLELIIKMLVAFLTLATLTAAIMSLPMIDWSVSGTVMPSSFDLSTVLFIAALVGWMPAPLDISVWQSQWTIAKMRDTGCRPTQGEVRLDFNIGYLATLTLALSFLFLGTAVMHSSGIGIVESPTGFVAQIIGLYEQTLGKWSSHIVGLAALAVMFSTSLTILDGFPRALADFTLLLQGKEEVAAEDIINEKQRRRYYWGYMLIMVIGALSILSFFLGSLTQLVDFAATISFLGAPVFAFLNHRAIMGDEISNEARPKQILRLWSICGIAALSAFALLYIYLAFGT